MNAQMIAYLSVMAAGLCAALWRQIAATISQLEGAFVCRVVVADDLAGAVLAHLDAEYRRSGLSPRSYGGFWDHVRPWGRFARVAFSFPGANGPIVYRRGWSIVVVRTAYANDFDSVNQALKVSFLRGSIDWDAFVLAALGRERAAREASVEGEGDSRFRVERLGGVGRRSQVNVSSIQASGDGQGGASRGSTGSSPSTSHQFRDYGVALLGLDWSDVGPPDARDGSAVDRLALPPDAARAVERARRWLSSRDWYADRGIAWKSSLGLFGPPGTGKTATVRAMAQDFGLPVFSIDLASMDNGDLAQAWSRVRADAPCVALIEDVDAVFRGRANVAWPDGGVSFDALLNTLDGVEPAEGVFLVVTTNHPEHLDPALGRPAAGGASTRPGRVDRWVELGPPDADGRRKLARRILADAPGLVEPTVAAGADESAVQFLKRCESIALAHFWGDDPGPEPEPSPAPEPPPPASARRVGPPARRDRRAPAALGGSRPVDCRAGPGAYI